MYTRRRIQMMRNLLETVGIEPERLRLEWASSAEGAKFARTVSDFTETLRELGPSPLKVKVS
jgi:F420-non-reducing hydrogenase iron-sulfur subunit